MQITTVKITSEVNIFGLSKWVGMEASLSEGENELAALTKIEQSINTYIDISTKAEIEKRKNNATPPEKKLTTEQTIIKEIENVTDLADIKVYLSSAEKNKAIKAAYDLQILKLKK